MGKKKMISFFTENVKNGHFPSGHGMIIFLFFECEDNLGSTQQVWGSELGKVD